MAANKGFLAKKLQQNWMTRFPDSRTTGLKEQVDDSLTNLNWLPNFDCRNALPSNQNGHAGGAGGTVSFYQNHLYPAATAAAAAAAAAAAIGCGGGSGGSVSTNSHGPFLPLTFPQNMSIASLPHSTPPDSPVPPPMASLNRSLSCEASFTSPPLMSHQMLTEKERAFYRTNSTMKPPYSYADLICFAMKDLRKSKITLSDIYNWIQENFIYYKLADPIWQNSVRHNLSLNKFFQKVPRRKDEPGKGGFWRINPQYLGDSIENNAMASNTKRRRNLPALSPSTPLGSKRARVGFGQHEDQSLPQHPQHHNHHHHHQHQHQQHHPQQQQQHQPYAHPQFLNDHPTGHHQGHHHTAVSRSQSVTEESLNLYPGALPRLSAFSDPYMAVGETNEASSLNTMLPQDEGMRQYSQAMSRASQMPLAGHSRASPIFSMAGAVNSHSAQRLQEHGFGSTASAMVASAHAPIQLPEPSMGTSPRRVSSGGSTSSGATPPLPMGDEFIEGFLAADLDSDDLPPIDLQDGEEGEAGDALDLTIHGVSLKPPEWWNSSLSSEKSILGPTLQSSLSCSFGRGGRILVDGRCGATPSPLALEENQLDLDQLDQLLGLN